MRIKGIIVKRLCIMFLLILLISFSSQEHNTDSLKQILTKYEKEGREDSSVINLLKELYNENRYINPALSIEYIDKAGNIYIKTGNNNGLANCYNLKGKIYFEQEMYSLAMENYFKCYEIMQKQNEYGALAYSLIDIANTYFAQKIYDVPLGYYRQAATIFLKINHKFGLSVAYNNIALVKRNTGRLDSALYYFNLALELRKKMNDPFLIAHSYYYIGKIYELKHNYEKALYYHKQTIKLLNQSNDTSTDRWNLEGDSYLETGNTLEEEKKYEEARKSFLQALAIYESIKNNLMICRTYIETGNLFTEHNKLKEAEDYIQKGLIIAKNNKYQNDEKKCYFLLYNINLKNKNKDIALIYLKKYADLSDSLNNRELTKKLNEVQIAIQTYSKEKENEFLRQKTKDIKRLSFAIILFLCSIILFAVYYLNNKQKNEKRWKQLSNVTFEGVVIYDNNKIIDCNNKFLQLFGYARKEISGKTIYDIILPENIEFIRNKMETEHVSDYEIEMSRKDRTTFFAEILVRHTTFRGKNARVAAIRDITQRKLIEEQLKKYTEELKELNATKDKFFSIIAHDLRNPFQGIIGLSDQLQQDLSTEDISNIKDFVSLINNSAKKAYYLLENLLEWTRAQTGRLKYEPSEISLNTLIDEEAELFEQIVKNKEIIFFFKQPSEIHAYADEKLVRTVLRNLISNAVKFTENKGKIDISLTEKNDNIEICVCDTGIGIRNEDKDKLFRIDVSQTKIGTTGEKGTGLGLILCKEFVEKNGGNIWFNSESGKGSKFCFTLPKVQQS